MAQDITGRKRAEEALRRSEEDYRRIFDHSNDAIFVIDPELDSIVDTNSRACTMLGCSPNELLAVPMSAVFQDEMAKFRAFVRSVIEAGEGWADELTCFTTGGRRLPAEISASSTESWGRTQIIAMVCDITGRKVAEKSTLEMALLAQLNPAPVLHVDNQGIVLSANSASVDILRTGENGFGSLDPLYPVWRTSI